MIVKMQSDGRGVTGLHIGTSNVRRHFPETLRSVELELDHLRIECELKPGFWRDLPEITDPRLGLWLEAKNARRKSPRTLPRVVMFPAGKQSFRLQIERTEADEEHPLPPAPAA